MTRKRSGAGEAVQVEADGHSPLHSLPAQGDHEEEGQVDLVEGLVEELVVADAAEIDDVAQQKVGEVAADRQQAARERPAQDGQRSCHAERGEEHDLESHRTARSPGRQPGRSRAQPTPRVRIADGTVRPRAWRRKALAGLHPGPDDPGMTVTAALPVDSSTPDSACAEPPDLAPPPAVSPTVQAISDASRTAFRHANRYVMVPFHRAGLAAWLGNPLTGWQCLLTTTGRRSGLPRHTPVGYLVGDGAAWALAGYGPSTLWYRNLLDDPRVTLLLPGRPPIPALAKEIRDPSVRARIIPPLARSMALPGALIGCFPPTASDERIVGCVSFVPLVRIAPADGTPLAVGPDDPGGLGWAWRQALALGFSFLAIRSIWRRLRG